MAGLSRRIGWVFAASSSCASRWPRCKPPSAPTSSRCPGVSGLGRKSDASHPSAPLQRQSGSPRSTPILPSADCGSGGRRLRGSRFAERLAAYGIADADFRQILGESNATLRARFSNPPAWLTTIRCALAPPPAVGALPTPNVSDETTAGFLVVIAPLIPQPDVACTKVLVDPPSGDRPLEL